MKAFCFDTPIKAGQPTKLGLFSDSYCKKQNKDI